jgi:hypothetical protein
MMAGIDIESLRASMEASNPKLFAQLKAKADAANARTAGVNFLADQLGEQASQYGFSWKVNNRPAKNHQQAMAKILYDKGVRNLSDLGYSEDGKSLINKTNGQIVPWYKDNTMDKNGRAQIGWNSEGKGRTDYYVYKDANGNPVVAPQWKSNAPKGVGGFLLKAAPAIAGAIGGPWAAAGVAGLESAASGDKFGKILKNAGLAGGTSYLGGQANLATQGALQGLDPSVIKALGSAAQGFTQSGLTGAATGNFSLKDALASGLSAGAAGGIQSLLSPQVLPAGQAGPPAPGAINTGSALLDRALTSTAAGTVGGVASGQNLGDSLVNSLTSAGSQAAGSQVAGMMPETGSTWLDNFLKNAGGTLASTAFTGLLNELTGGTYGGGTSPSSTYGANPNLRPIQTESTGQDNMVKFLELANSLQGQQQTAQAPVSPGFDVSRAFEPTRYAQNQQSLPDFLQSSNRNFA